MSSEATKRMASFGRMKDLGDGSGIQEGQVFVRGALPVPKDAAPHPMWGDEGKIGVPRSTVALPIGSDPKTLYKAMSSFSPIAQCDAGEENREKMIRETFEKIKAVLEPGQVLRDLTLTSVGRPDVSYKIISQAREVGVPIVESE